MKLASLRNGHRDGQLVIVRKDLARFYDCSQICATMQQLLDSWDKYYPPLEELSQKLNTGELSGSPFEPKQCLSPLPRAYEWVDGSAYINHIKLVRKARGAEPPEDLLTNPLVYQGGSGVLLGPRDDIELGDQSWGCDFESEICVVLGDVPQGCSVTEAQTMVRLLTIANDVSLRNLIPEELKKGFGFFNSKPATAFAPCLVTLDELGDTWRDGRVHLPLTTKYNGEMFGQPEAGPEMHFSFFQLIEHITKTRSFCAGTILGSGTVSNEDQNKGSSCLAEKRMIEKIETGNISTQFMKFGDSIEIDLCHRDGSSICGSISQRIVSKR